MRARDFRHNAWNKLNGKWGMTAILFLLYVIVSGACTSTMVLAIVLSGPLMLGFTTLIMGIVRENKNPEANALLK